MKQNHWPARLAAGCLVTLSLVGVALAAEGQGSRDDPLVTLSYLTEQTTPSILSEVDSMVEERQAELEQRLSDVVDRYLLEGGGPAAQPSGGAVYQAVNLTAGQTIVGSAACEFLLRSGSAACVSPDKSTPGLVDVTGGDAIGDGAALQTNHLYAMTAVRGVRAADAVTLLVRGEYTIA